MLIIPDASSGLNTRVCRMPLGIQQDGLPLVV